MRSKNRYKGQSTLEYAVIIAVVVGALLAIQIYMKRGIQGKLRDSTDQIGEQFDAENTAVNRTTTRTGNTVQAVSAGVTTVDSGEGSLGGAKETRTETGSETVGAW
jgi:hypothetical protein